MSSFLTWGQRGAPLLPKVFREAVDDYQLPRWVCDLVGLEFGATADALCTPIESRSGSSVDIRLRNFACKLAQARMDMIAHLPAISVSWPTDRHPSQIPWSLRIQNCLKQHGVFDNVNALSSITLQELSWIQGMGIRSILGFAVTAELALGGDSPLPAPAEKPEEPRDLERELKHLTSVLRQPWAEQIVIGDPRFRGMLKGGITALQPTIDFALQMVDGRLIDKLTNAIPAIEAKVQEISTLSLEEALDDLFVNLAPRQSERKIELMCRLGWLGKPPITLEECGQQLGITRERVRQIQAQLLQRLPNEEVFLPQLDQAIEVLERAAPLPVAEASALLIESEICKIAFSPESVLAAASDLKRETSLQVKKIKGKRLLVADKDDRATRKLFAIARSQSGALGATNVSEVLAQIESEDGIPIDADRAKSLLRNLDDIEFLCDEWFWMSSIRPDRNRLRNISRRMLSVASPISVAKLRGGVRREYTFRNSAGSFKWTLVVPPVDVLREWYRQHPEFVVDHNDCVTHVDQLEARQELGDVDNTIVEVLRATPTCVLDRASIREACLKRGINAHSLEVALTYSSVLEHVETNIWTLRGVSVEPTAITAVRELNALKPRQRRVRDFGWTTNGKIWISVITPAYRYVTVFGVPGGVKKILAGQKFEAFAAGGQKFGSVGISDNGTAYGYEPFLRQVGADEGDTFLLVFDLQNQVVTLHLGDESILDEFAES